MEREILMFYGQECPNAVLMMPAVMGLNMSGKYKIKLNEIWHNQGGKKEFEKYKTLIKNSTGHEDAVPVFLEVKNKKAILANDFEALMAWLEGPEWWKKYM